MALLKTTTGRLLLSAAFLTTAMLSSGYLAVALGYPSLWGTSSSVWVEYTVPLPYNWAFSHIFSMLPLALLVGSFPVWPQPWIVRARWILVMMLVGIFFAEVKLPYGRLRHVPFFLFFAVDTALALIFTLLFFRTRRLFAVIGTIVLTLIIAVALLRQALEPDKPSRQQETSNHSAPAAQNNTKTGQFFEEVRSDPPGNSKAEEIVATVSANIGPNLGPTPERICAEAKTLLTSASASRVKLMVHPWFEKEAKYIYPAGSAGYDKAGIWRCDFTYPTPAP